MLTIGDILKTNAQQAVTASLATPVVDAARLLRGRRIGIVVVTAQNGVVEGVVSERDVIKLVAENRSPDGLTVADICTFKPVTCVRDDLAEDVLRTMQDNGFRHMPVVEFTRLLGVVSIGDLLSHMLDAARNA